MYVLRELAEGVRHGKAGKGVTLVEAILPRTIRDPEPMLTECVSALRCGTFPLWDGAMATAVSYLSVDQKGRATLPEDVRASLGLKPGDFVLLERTQRGTYELVPAALVPRDQLWFHHPQMQRRIGKAEADLAKGRTHVTRSAEEAQALLDRFKGKRSRGRR